MIDYRPIPILFFGRKKEYQGLRKTEQLDHLPCTAPQWCMQTGIVHVQSRRKPCNQSRRKLPSSKTTPTTSGTLAWLINLFYHLLQSKKS